MAVPRYRGGSSVPLLRQVLIYYWASKVHVRGTRAAAVRCSDSILVEILVRGDLDLQGEWSNVTSFMYLRVQSAWHA
jgi:hypothetical protein